MNEGAGVDRKELAARLATAGAAPDARAVALVDTLGRHAHVVYGIELDEPSDDDLARWMLLAAVLDPRLEEATALAAMRAVERAAGAPSRVADAEPSALADALRNAGHPRPEPCAALLWRLGRSLRETRLASLAAECDGLDELGARLSKLAPGFGRAAVVRFLAPLRESSWPGAWDLPLERAAHAAAVHLGFLSPEDDPEQAIAILRRLLSAAEDAPRLADLEAALGRLGRRACRRERWRRCPLGSACPLYPKDRDPRDRRTTQG